MKTIFFLLAATFFSMTAYCQRHAFSTICLKEYHNNQALVFTVPSELNVRHYRIEVSNDNVDFKIISTIPAKGNSMLPVKYNYDISAYDYAYYKVVLVGMDGNMPCSDVVEKTRRPAGNGAEQPVREMPVHAGSGLATN